MPDQPVIRVCNPGAVIQRNNVMILVLVWCLAPARLHPVHREQILALADGLVPPHRRDGHVLEERKAVDGELVAV